MKTLAFECPEKLNERLDDFVREGWGADKDHVLVEALRRYLDSHRPDLVEAQILTDIEWGLRGEG